MQNVSVVLVIAYNAFGYMGIIVSQAIADVLTAMIAMILFKRQLYREFHYNVFRTGKKASVYSSEKQKTGRIYKVRPVVDFM